MPNKIKKLEFDEASVTDFLILFAICLLNKNVLNSKVHK